MRVKVIINPAAGQSEPILSVLNDVFGRAGIEWDVAITHKSGDGLIAARAAAGQGYDLIGAYGGDGSVAEEPGEWSSLAWLLCLRHSVLRDRGMQWSMTWCLPRGLRMRWRSPL